MEERSDSDTRSKERTVVRRGEEKKKKRKIRYYKIFPLFTSRSYFLFIAVNEKLVFRLE